MCVYWCAPRLCDCVKKEDVLDGLRQFKSRIYADLSLGRGRFQMFYWQILYCLPEIKHIYIIIINQRSCNVNLLTNQRIIDWYMYLFVSTSETQHWTKVIYHKNIGLAICWSSPCGPNWSTVPRDVWDRNDIDRLRSRTQHPGWSVCFFSVGSMCRSRTAHRRTNKVMLISHI